MAIFNSYVKLPEGILIWSDFQRCFSDSTWRKTLVGLETVCMLCPLSCRKLWDRPFWFTFIVYLKGLKTTWKLREDGSLQISRATELVKELVHGQGIASEVGTPTRANGLEMRGRCVCWSTDIFRMGTRFMEIFENLLFAFASNHESIILNHLQSAISLNHGVLNLR